MARDGLRVRSATTGMVALSLAALAAAEAEAAAAAERKKTGRRSKFVGVRWHKAAGTWAAYLTPAQPGIRACSPSVTPPPRSRCLYLLAANDYGLPGNARCR